MNRKLPLPPFGKVLAAYQEENITLIGHIEIFVGKSAKNVSFYNKRHGQLCCYLPYGDDYRSYRWPIFDQNVCIVETDLSSVNFLKQMAIDLFKMYLPKSIFISAQSIPAEELFFLVKEKVNE